jgi:hypothetical protein
MFKYTICEPLNPNIIDKGSVTKEEFLEVLNRFPWQEMQKEMEAAEESKICYSPSLELIDLKCNHGLAISIVGQEFYIFYKRPKTVKKRKWFSSVEVFEPEYMSDRTGQNEKDVEEAFNALLESNFELLESRWG